MTNRDYLEVKKLIKISKINRSVLIIKQYMDAVLKVYLS